jgi:cytochrome c oxidase assembly factor CtaG
MKATPRTALSVGGVALWVLALVPPVASWATRYEFVQVLQFSVAAFVAPALVTLGAPWRRLGWTSTTSPRWLDRVAKSRATEHHQQRAAYVAVLFVILSVLARIAPVVNFVAPRWWASVVQAVVLSGSGMALFTELVESPPLSPRASRPYRIGVSAVVMWSAWIVAYLEGMSRVTWYGYFTHVTGRAVSLPADQQLVAAMTWFVTAVVFLPIVFSNLMKWLSSGNDEKEELAKLIREERHRGFFGSD